MKKKYLFLLVFCIACHSTAQDSLSIEECYDLALKNYPLVKHYTILESLKEYTIENANRGYLPQIGLVAKASYQSDVTKLPFSPPAIKIQEMDKDQYSVGVEVNQLLWDGGTIEAQKASAALSHKVDKEKITVELYALKERVNQLFFGILLIDEQLVQNDILLKELQTNNNRIRAYMYNGIANQADLNALAVEKLNALQRRIEMNATLAAYKDMLSILIGKEGKDTYLCKKPNNTVHFNAQTVQRPELRVFEAQKNLFIQQRSSIFATSRPRFSLFAQGLYGRPGLNMLKNEFTFNYIAGIRLNWNISSFYTQRNSLSAIQASISAVGLQEETFLFNTRLKSIQHLTEIEKCKQLIDKDDEILVLRKSIKNSAEAKVANGTLSVSDLIREINAENLAAQLKILHQIQLLLSLYTLKNTLNN